MKALLFGLALLLCSAPAAHADVFGHTVAPGMFGPPLASGSEARGIPQTNGYLGVQLRERQRVIAILKLRNEAMRVQAQDGGTLAPEHQAQLQAKLDAIHAKWK